MSDCFVEIHAQSVIYDNLSFCASKRMTFTFYTKLMVCGYEEGKEGNMRGENNKSSR